MKLMKWFGLLFTICLSAAPITAQETNQVEQLKKQLQELQSSFQKAQEQQRQQIETLQKQIETLLQREALSTNRQGNVPPTAATNIIASAGDNKSWSSAQP